jgi:hypothetical protein
MSSGSSTRVVFASAPRLCKSTHSAVVDLHSSASLQIERFVGVTLPTLSILGERLIRVAIQPALSRLCRGDHWVFARPGMLAGVLVGRAVATTCAAALLTGAQVQPSRTDLHAIFAFTLLGLLDGLDGAEMKTGLVTHRRSPLIQPAHGGRMRSQSILRPPPRQRV